MTYSPLFFLIKKNKAAILQDWKEKVKTLKLFV